MTGKILIIGDLMLDRYWSGIVERISPEAPVPVVNIEEITERAGGAGNVAANVAALGRVGQLLSVVGDDESGRRLAGILGKAGVDRYLHIDPQMRTTEKLRVVSRNQQLIRLDFEQDPHGEVLKKVFGDYRRLIADASVVVVSDYGKGAVENIELLIELANTANVPVVVDPKGDDFTRYRRASVITPNLAEFKTVAGPCDSPTIFEARARELVRDLEIEALLITLGSQGMVLYLGSGEKYQQGSVAREVYDVSGAGDTVVAAVSVSMVEGVDWPRILEYANTAAGIVVGKFGTAVVSMDELKSELKKGLD